MLISTSSFGQIDGHPLALLDAMGIDYLLNPHGRKLLPEEALTLLRDVDGVIAGTERLDRSILAQLPRLRVVSRCGTGLDNVDLEAARELGIRVFNTPDALADAVSELALGGILDLLRHIAASDRLIRQGRWQKQMGSLLRGKTVGIVGLGRIGKALARLLQPFGVTLLAHDLHQDESFARANDVHYCTLDELLATADVVSLHLAYSSDCYHLVDRTRLMTMKPGAILVNCARGGIVDEEGLAELLRDGTLGGAFLDTFEQEPYQGPLIDLPNVLLTPHVGSYAQECRLRMEVEAVENLLRFFREEAAR